MADWIKQWLRQILSAATLAISLAGSDVSVLAADHRTLGNNDAAGTRMLVMETGSVSDDDEESRTQESSSQDRPATSAFLNLDGDQPQDDNNSCGPNSAARMLRYYGYDASYYDLRRRFHQDDPVLSTIGLGIPGAGMAGLMREYGYDASDTQATFGRVLTLLSEGKPVVVMIRVGTVDMSDQLAGNRRLGVFGQVLGKVGALLERTDAFPALHWIAVQGFDLERSVIFYTDTTGGHGEMSFEDFEPAFNWRCGNEVSKKLLDIAGVRPGSIVY